MRGRFLLVAAFLLLALVSPAQAVSSPSGAVAAGGSGEDPCLDVMAAVHDPQRAIDEPRTVLHFASHCTVDLDVSVHQTAERTVITIDAEPLRIVIERAMENGTLVVTVAVAYAEHGESFVVRCSDPGRLPQVGGDAVVKDASCWSVDEWLRID